MKVMVRMPSRGAPKAYSVDRMRMWEKERPDWDWGIHTNFYSVSVCRNEIVKEAAQKDVDFLIMFDDDTIPTREMLDMPDLNKPVLSGIVPCWQQGHFFWNAFEIDHERRLFKSISEWDGDPRKVYASGTAIMCIRKDVLQDPNMRPLFSFKVDEWGCLVPVGGEDVQFSTKCQANGHEMWVNPRVQGEHWRELNMLQTLIAVEGSKDNVDWHVVEQFAIGLDVIGWQLPGCSYETQVDKQIRAVDKFNPLQVR